MMFVYSDREKERGREHICEKIKLDVFIEDDFAPHGAWRKHEAAQEC